MNETMPAPDQAGTAVIEHYIVYLPLCHIFFSRRNIFYLAMNGKVYLVDPPRI